MIAVESMQPLVAELARLIRAQPAPALVGIAGAQGSGKSTLSAQLARSLEADFGLHVAVLSLDDVYLPRSERERLGRALHPLLVTRGVPGTHDVELGVRTLDALLSAQPGQAVRVPRFDKAHDDRVPEALWSSVTGPFDAVLFEGWCVGALPEPEQALARPINALEQIEDADARFRRHVNAQLSGAYRALFARLDRLVFLAVPDLHTARAWRREQEQKLAATAGAAPGVMNDAALERFAQHFERISRHMLAEAPSRADIVLRLGPDHACEQLELRRH